MALIQTPTHYWTFSSLSNGSSQNANDSIGSTNLLGSINTYTYSGSGPFAGYSTGVFTSFSSLFKATSDFSFILYLQINNQTSDQIIINKDSEYTLTFNYKRSSLIFNMNGVEAVIPFTQSSNWQRIVLTYSTTSGITIASSTYRLGAKLTTTVTPVDTSIQIGNTSVGLADFVFIPAVLTNNEITYLMNNQNVKYPFDTIYAKESLSLTETATNKGPFSLTVVESFSVIETPSNNGAITASISESLSFTEPNQKDTLSHSIESLDTTESLTYTRLLDYTVEEELFLVEDVTPPTTHSFLIIEALSLSEHTGRHKDASVNESLTLSESLCMRPATDSLTYSETFLIHKGPQATETLAFIETLSYGKSLGRTVSESLILSETLTMLGRISTKGYNPYDFSH